MNRSLSAAALAAVLFVPAMAQPASITVSASAPTGSGLYQQKAVSVQVADVDPGSAHGAAALLDRINAAARVVCGERPGQTMNTARAKLFAACQARTVAEAVQAVDAPALTQLAAAR